MQELPLTDATDNAILMHRDAHFGGNFDLMLNYYERQGKGASSEFEIARIRELQELEKNLDQNLAALLLSGPEAERIAQSRTAYKKLRALYTDKTAHSHAQLIADLILSEEEHPEKEMAAIEKEKGAIVPALMDLLRSEDFHDPLFPGYGLAPALASQCLGRIGDKRALIALFESIGDEDVFNEDIILDALHSIGAPAKQFLLKVLHGRPFTFDNERAAVALGRFKEDPEVAESCFKMLKELDLKEHLLLATHLILACEGLQKPELRKEFVALSKAAATTPSLLRQDLQAIAHTWE